MAAILLDASPLVTVDVSASLGKATLFSGAVVSVDVSAAAKVTIGKGIAATVSTGAEMLFVDMARNRGLTTRDDIPVILVTGTTSPSASGILSYTGVASGRPYYTNNGYSINEISIPDGVYIQLIWQTPFFPVGNYWSLHLFTISGLVATTLGLWKSTSDVATPDLATGWTAVTGTGTPVVAYSLPYTTPFVDVASSGDLQVSKSVSATVVATTIVSANLQVRNFNFGALVQAGANTSANLNLGVKLKAEATVGAEAQVKLYNIVVFQASTQITVTTKPALDAGRDGLGVCDVIREILLLWGMEQPCKAAPFARTHAIIVLNTAMQVIWNQAKDRSFWSRVTLSFSFAAGIAEAALTDLIQNVIGPARLDSSRQPLVSIGTRAELDQFADLYLDGESAGRPVAYHIARENQAGKEPCKTTLLLTPTPEEDLDVLLDVVLEAPRFSWNDVDNCPRVPIPHRYVETLLLPVAMYYASQSHLFLDSEGRKEQIKADYLAATQQLELADPLPGKTGDNINRRQEART